MLVMADCRELASGIPDSLRKQEGVHLSIGQLACGDYIIDSSVTIERKTGIDFQRSIIDGRLFKQLANLKKRCTKPILLLEGDPFNAGCGIDRMAVKGAMISVQAMWHVPLILSHSKKDTVEIIMTIGKQYGRCCDVLSLRGGYRPRRMKSRQLFILQGLPRIGPSLARRLIEHFGSVARVMNAGVGDLVLVRGIGRKSAEAIRAVLDHGITC